MATLPVLSAVAVLSLTAACGQDAPQRIKGQGVGGTWFAVSPTESWSALLEK